MSNAIDLIDFTKSYADAKSKTKTKIIIDKMNLVVHKGEFFGLLGPNGAGKSTTINAITGVVSVTGGKIKVLGHDNVLDYRLARAKIGVSPQEFNIDIFQTVDEILDYAAGFFGIIGTKMKTRREELISKFELGEHRGKKFQFLSGGLKRRVILAKAMMHNPDILILDEPTAGVDVESRRSLWKYLKQLHQEGKTIILTSHYLEEVEELCQRVAIINNGKIIKLDTVDNITKGERLEDVYVKLIEQDNNK